MQTILLGTNTPFKFYERGYVDVDEETFYKKNCVPTLSTNLFSIYQIIHSSSSRQVEFTPNSMVIIEMTNGAKIIVGKVDHQS
jgi:hypothetical protein